MQADGMTLKPGQAPRYRGLFHAFSDIIRTEGVLGLWKGAGPTCSRAAVLAASELATYDEIKHQLTTPDNWFPDLPEGPILHVSTGVCAGFVSAVCSSPFDVVKSRVMNQAVGADGKGLKYSGMLDCFRKSIAAEGPFCLWKGFWPNFGRIGPRVTVIFVVMEQLRKYYD
jgi:hypothetical protein